MSQICLRLLLLCTLQSRPATRSLSLNVLARGADPGWPELAWCLSYFCLVLIRALLRLLCGCFQFRLFQC